MPVGIIYKTSFCIICLLQQNKEKFSYLSGVNIFESLIKSNHAGQTPQFDLIKMSLKLNNLDEYIITNSEIRTNDQCSEIFYMGITLFLFPIQKSERPARSFSGTNKSEIQ